MKSVIVNKDNNYSLNNSDNYKKLIECNLREVTQKYGELLLDYLNFIYENIKIKNKQTSQFIIIRGLDTITNVFLHIFSMTKNIDLTYFHCQKSFYFYVEFVGQITDDEKTFLQLTSRDATTYVYKKTIFDINNEFKIKNELINKDFKDKMDKIKNYINLYQTYVLKIIYTENKNINDIDNIIKIFDRLNNLHNKTEIAILTDITDILFYNIQDNDKFYELSNLIVKKFVKNSTKFKNLNKKINTYEFNDKLLQEPTDKFIIWLFKD